MKGIIVVDIPECCDMCKMGFNNECSDEFECFMEQTKRLKNPESEKPDWCPINPIPQKREYKGIEAVNGLLISTRVKQAIDEAGKLGWNSCIDAIIGEK